MNTSAPNHSSHQAASPSQANGNAPSKAAALDWQDIVHGSNWKNKKTGAACIVQSTPKGFWDSVKLLHASGIVSSKGVHYFLYDYTPDGRPVEAAMPPRAEANSSGAFDASITQPAHSRERG